MYKGAEIEAECRRELRAAIADGNPAPEIQPPADPSMNVVRFENCGIGVRPLLYALCHPEVKVVASDPDPDNCALLAGLSGLPENLTVR